jgi:hypothetical protein
VSGAIWVRTFGMSGSHTVDRFLINLRDATAHGDARIVSPFNVLVERQHLLAGFSFECSEKRDGRKTWEGKITLLETDMRRIGIQLAKAYLQRPSQNRAPSSKCLFRS